jgi:hypothetical protein
MESAETLSITTCDAIRALGVSVVLVVVLVVVLIVLMPNDGIVEIKIKIFIHFAIIIVFYC